MENSTDKSKDWPGADRTKQKSIAGSSLFVLLRCADVALQYGILASPAVARLINSLGGRAISPVSSSTNFLGLTPYHSTVLAFAVGSCVKQVVWELGISAEMMSPSFAALIGAFNTGSNTVNTVLSLWSFSSQAPSLHGQSLLPVTGSAAGAFPLAFYAGLVLYGIGISVELISELQRKAFKTRPENSGKPYTGGLFSLATNINYGGYTLWRTGYALACGGWPWGLFVGVGQAYDFATRAIPSMDHYIASKYGEAGARTRRSVRWRLIPFVY